MKVFWLSVLACLGLASAQYDYKEVLRKSILFYEMQRSGRLINNRIPWRGDSFLNDAEGVDLSGGYFDAGDHVKFGLPLGHTITFLAWSIVDYKDAYQSAGELENARAAIRWGCDWLLKAIKIADTPDIVVYGQVGDGNTDHAYWGRPEEFPSGSYRPAFKITSSQPGSDLAGSYITALMASSMALREVDAAYANRLVETGRNLYWFANNYRGIYSDHITDAQAFYKSFDYTDELTFAAAWIAYATGDEFFKTESRSKYNEFNMGDGGAFFDWGEKRPGVAMLMARIFGDQQYKDDAARYCDNWVYGQPRTPKGLVYINDWGSLRHAANAAYGCLLAADLGLPNTYNYRAFAKQQINYALGDSGRSYVLGFGNNPPQKSHHRAASCPDLPAPCGYDQSNSPNPNPQILYGALAGGPDRNDQFTDARDNYQQNEVANSMCKADPLLDSNLSCEY